MEGNTHKIRTDGGGKDAPVTDQQKQAAQTHKEPHHENLDGLNDEQLMSVSMDQEFSKFKAEQRTLLEQKNAI